MEVYAKSNTISIQIHSELITPFPLFIPAYAGTGLESPVYRVVLVFPTRSGGGNVPNTIGGTFLSRPQAYPDAQSNHGIGIKPVKIRCVRANPCATSEIFTELEG